MGDDNKLAFPAPSQLPYPNNRTRTVDNKDLHNPPPFISLSEVDGQYPKDN